MMHRSRPELVRRWGWVAVSALAVVLIAAAADPVANWARIRTLSPEQRTKLLQNLDRFDLQLTPEKRQAVRELDRRLAELPPAQQSEYLAVLRRFHTWLARLPENLQNELLAQPPAERMALIRNLVVAHPVPRADTPQLLRLADLGEYSPFELASIYKIWKPATPHEREKIERLAERPRRQALFRLGAQRKSPIPRETRPPGYDEEKWTADIEEYWRKSRPLLLLEEVVNKKKLDETTLKKFEARRREILRRQAINGFVAGAEVHSVDPGRLAQFVAELPAWVQSTLESYPPDEARRRLSFAYRLVFPYPEELKAGGAPPAAPAQAKGPAAAPPKGVGASPDRPQSDTRTNASAPF
jgi:hypothetical protein